MLYMTAWQGAIYKVGTFTMLLKMRLASRKPYSKKPFSRKPFSYRDTRTTDYLKSALFTGYTRINGENGNSEEPEPDIPGEYPAMPVGRIDTHALEPRYRLFYERWTSLVSEHYFEPDLSVAKLARLSCLSQRQLFNKVKYVTGRSPRTFLSEFRISLAMRLLGTEAISISQIAEETGFSSASSFSKTFRKIVGVTPSEYRKRAAQCQNIQGKIQ